MPTFIWTAFAVIAMAGIFASCVLVVTVGTRYVEEALAKRKQKAE